MDAKRNYVLFFLLLFLAGAVIFLFKLGGRDLWDPDEPRYALVAREMRQSGDWMVPHLNGEIYVEKPPLFFWLINLSTFVLGGDTELANRLPSALAGLATMLMTFFFGSKVFNPRVGFLSGLVLATCFLFPQISRWMMLDSLFTLCFLLALYCFYLGVNGAARSKITFMLAGVCMACGTLTKGPIAYLPIPLFLIYALMVGDFRKIWNRNLLYAVLLSVGLVSAWFFPAVSMAGKTYGTENLWRQTFGRFMGGWSHPEPFYFYFIRFPLGFLPWALFLPWAFNHGFRQMSAEKRKGLLFLFVWFSFIFLFFTFSKGKKDNYLLPLYPAAALGVVHWIASFWGSSKRTGRTHETLWIPMGLITLCCLAGWLMILVSPAEWFPRRAVPYFPFLFWSLSIVTLGGILSLLFHRWRWYPSSIFCFIAAFIIVQVYIAMNFVPWLNGIRSPRPFSEQIIQRMAPGDQLKMWKFQHMGIQYYTGKAAEQIRKVYRLLEVFHGSGRIFMVVEEEDFDWLKGKVDLPFHVVERGKVAHQTLFLVSNRGSL